MDGADGRCRAWSCRAPARVNSTMEDGAAKARISLAQLLSAVEAAMASVGARSDTTSKTHVNIRAVTLDVIRSLQINKCSCLQGGPNQNAGERDHHDARSAGDHIRQDRVPVFAHKGFAVDEEQHERQHERQQDSVGNLRDQDYLQQREMRDQDEARAENDQAGVEAVKDGRLAEPSADSSLEPEAFTDVGGA